MVFCDISIFCDFYQAISWLLSGKNILLFAVYTIVLSLPVPEITVKHISLKLHKSCTRCCLCINQEACTFDRSKATSESDIWWASNIFHVKGQCVQKYVYTYWLNPNQYWGPRFIWLIEITKWLVCFYTK